MDQSTDEIIVFIVQTFYLQTLLHHLTHELLGGHLGPNYGILPLAPQSACHHTMKNAFRPSPRVLIVSIANSITLKFKSKGSSEIQGKLWAVSHWWDYSFHNHLWTLLHYLTHELLAYIPRYKPKQEPSVQHLSFQRTVKIQTITAKICPALPN